MAKRKQILNPNQLPLIIPVSTWEKPSSLPENLLKYPVIGLDTETKDPELDVLGPSWFRGGGEVVGISLAWADGKIYLPIAHAGGDNIDKTMVIEWLKHLLSNYTGVIVFANGFYDLGWLRMEGIPVPSQATFWDVQMVEALLNEHKQRYNLASILETYKLPPKNETLLREAAAAFGCDPKKDLWRLAGRFVGAYAEDDAVPLLKVYATQLEKVKSQELEKVVKLEHDLIPLLLEMRFKGVKVDVKMAEQHMKAFDDEYEGHRKEIQRITGYLPDVWTPDSCAVAMDRAGIKYRMTATGKPSFTDEWLSGHDHQVPKLITLARKAYKAGQVFCRGTVLDHADKNGRIHSEFHPLRTDDNGTVSGRFSCSNPNLQQIPVREPRMGTLIRGLFLPEDGELWCAADYSQQEPRLTIHYASVNNCSKAQEAVDRYNNQPDTDYHQMTADLAGITRKEAKPINLGLAYGMGGAKLARKLGLPTVMKKNYYNGREYESAGPEAQEILDKYHSGLPFIRELTKMYSDIASREGQIRTLSSRLCRFLDWEHKDGGRAMSHEEAIRTYGENNIKRSFTYAALNRKIQGGSADMIKISLRNLWKEKFVPLVTVHDENGLSVPDNKTARMVVEIMRDCVKLRVPLKVDCDVGASWGIAKPITEEEE